MSKPQRVHRGNTETENDLRVVEDDGVRSLPQVLIRGGSASRLRTAAVNESLMTHRTEVVAPTGKIPSPKQDHFVVVVVVVAVVVVVVVCFRSFSFASLYLSSLF